MDEFESNVSKRSENKEHRLTKEKFLSEIEYAHLKRLVRWDKSRSAIMIKLLMYTAARAGELLSVRLKDLDPKAKTVFIRGEKGSRDREIPLKDWYFYELYNYALKICKGPEDRLFPFSYQILYRSWERYKPCSKTIHSMRHTCAVRAYEDTKDIKFVQTLLGHKSINNTMIYLDFVHGRKVMRKILKVRL